MKILAIVSLLLTNIANAENPAPTWEHLYNDDGISVSRQEIPGSDVCAFRGVGDVDAPVEKVLTLVRDISHARDWIDRVVDIKMIREPNKLERILYYRIALPWPLRDRDFVYKTTLAFDPATKSIAYTAQSVTDPAMPEQDGVVRGEIFKSTIVITALDGGKRTHAIGEAHADPRGSIPKWVVNLIQKKWPYNTFTNVREAVKKFEPQPDPAAAELVKEMLEPATAPSANPVVDPNPKMVDRSQQH